MISVGRPLTYLITDGSATAENFTDKKTEILKLLKVAAAANISFIQIREKNLPARLVFELASAAVKLTRGAAAEILVNDRADIAFAAEAGGVHLTSRSLSAEIIRQNFPADFVVGVSVHTVEEAASAKQQGADFVTFSPIFRTPGKGQPRGVAELREVCEKMQPFPVIALGGINETNYQTVLKNGASGFAAIRFLNKPENLKKLSAEFYDCFPK